MVFVLPYLSSTKQPPLEPLRTRTAALSTTVVVLFMPLVYHAQTYFWVYSSPLAGERNKMTVILYEPGQKVPISGQYNIVDSNGNMTKYQVTCVLGEHFPPLKFKGYTFVLTDPTIHHR